MIKNTRTREHYIHVIVFKPHSFLIPDSSLLFQILTQALSFTSGESVHGDFQTLNGDINSPSASYILKLANRLYGENTANFLPVSFQFTLRYKRTQATAIVN